MISVIAVAVAAYVAFVGALYLGQRSLLYYPDTSVPSPAASGLPEMATVRLDTDDGLRLLAWYRAAPADRPTVVYFHGNAGSIGGRAFKVRPYLDAGFGLLLVEYRGYGGNPGKPTETGLYADGRAALAFLDVEGVAATDLILYGESLGSGVAVHLAAERGAAQPVGGLILEAPFSSMAAVAAHHYPFVPARSMVKDRYDSDAKIARIGAPLLIVHGDRDRTVPPRFGRRLFDAAIEPKEIRLLTGARHNDLYDFGAAEAVIEFIERARAKTSAP